MRRWRVFHVIRADADLSNAIFTGSDSEVNIFAEHRRRWFLPQVGRMRGARQFLRSKRTTLIFPVASGGEACPVALTLFKSVVLMGGIV